MTQNSRISLFVITGMSGAGKSTLTQHFIRNHPEFELCSSYTTRTRHDQEHYRFISRTDFLQMIKAGKFLEFMCYPTGEFYGTALADLEDIRSRNHIPLLDVNTDGLKQILAHPAVDPLSVLSVFVLPPDIRTLKERLLKRHRESYDEIIIRLKAGLHELEQISLCDGVAVNDSLGEGLAMMEYLYRLPREGFGADTEFYVRDLNTLISHMEDGDSLEILQERIAYDRTDQVSNPYDAMKEAMTKDVRSFLSDALHIVLSSAAQNSISIQELAYGKDD